MKEVSVKLWEPGGQERVKKIRELIAEAKRRTGAPLEATSEAEVFPVPSDRSTHATIYFRFHDESVYQEYLRLGGEV